MESISRDISDLAENEKTVIETVLGHALRENQRVIIQVIDIDLGEDSPPRTPSPTIDDFAIFSDLDSTAIVELEDSILSRSPSRDNSI